MYSNPLVNMAFIQQRSLKSSERWMSFPVNWMAKIRLSGQRNTLLNSTKRKRRTERNIRNLFHNEENIQKWSSHIQWRLYLSRSCDPWTGHSYHMQKHPEMTSSWLQLRWYSVQSDLYPSDQSILYPFLPWQWFSVSWTTWLYTASYRKSTEDTGKRSWVYWTEAVWKHQHQPWLWSF